MPSPRIFLLAACAVAGAFVAWLLAQREDPQRFPPVVREPVDSKRAPAQPDAKLEHPVAQDAASERSLAARPNATPADAAPSFDLGVLEIGTIAGEVLLPDGATPELYQIEVEHARPEGARGKVTGAATLDATRAFRIEGLAPGAWELHVRADEALLTLSDVRVVTARDAHDARLHPIDLRALYTAVHVEVVDADERALAASWVVGLRTPGAERSNAAPAMPYAGRGPSRFELLVPHAGLDVLVGAAGRASKLVRSVRADQRVVLEPALACELRAEGSEPLSDDDVRLGVVITLDAPPEGWPADRGDLVWEFFDARRALSVELTTPGRYTLAWCFAPTGKEAPDAVGFLQEARVEPIVIEPGASRFDLRLAPPPGLLRLARERSGLR